MKRLELTNKTIVAVKQENGDAPTGHGIIPCLSCGDPFYWFVTSGPDKIEGYCAAKKCLRVSLLYEVKK